MMAKSKKITRSQALALQALQAAGINILDAPADLWLGPPAFARVAREALKAIRPLK